MLIMIIIILLRRNLMQSGAYCTAKRKLNAFDSLVHCFQSLHVFLFAQFLLHLLETNEMPCNRSKEYTESKQHTTEPNTSSSLWDNYIVVVATNTPSYWLRCYVNIFFSVSFVCVCFVSFVLNQFVVRIFVEIGSFLLCGFIWFVFVREIPITS